MRVSMVGSGGEGGQCNNREPREVGAEPVDSSAEREPGDVERHGNSGHGGDGAFDLEAQGLIGGDGDGHGVVVKKRRIRRLPVGRIRLVACPYYCHAAPCCAVRCAGLLTGCSGYGSSC